MTRSTRDYPNWPPEDAKPTISHSSLNEYADCRRRWLFEKEARVLPWAQGRIILQEKAMQPNAVLVGSIVDAIIERSFRHYIATGERPDVYLRDLDAVCREEFRLRSRFTRLWQRAIADDQEIPNPYNMKPMEGLVRTPLIDRYEAQRLIDLTVKAIKHLLDSPLYARIMAYDRSCLKLQPRGTIRGQKIAIPWFWAGAIAIYASYDLIVITPEGILIVDWKTGGRERGEERAEIQLNYYAAFVIAEFGVPTDRIELVAAWIGEGAAISTFELDTDFVQRNLPRWTKWREKVTEDLEAVRRDARLVDERFPMVTDIYNCRFCRFHSCPGFKRHKTVAVSPENGGGSLGDGEKGSS